MEWKAGVRGVRLEAALIGVVARVSVIDRRQSRFAMINLLLTFLQKNLQKSFLKFERFSGRGLLAQHRQLHLVLICDFTTITSVGPSVLTISTQFPNVVHPHPTGHGIHTLLP